ncbi:MAG: hypothetical protein U1C59_05880, partial [Methylotenera sp.]|nr:hypothetical protein [Methylotenera sp.]
TGQVKVHKSGNAATYTADMLKDHRSGSFFVPDDHVEQLKAYLESKSERLRAVANYSGVDARCVDPNRVKGLGATYAKIYRDTQQARSESLIVKNTPYVFLGVASTFLVAPAVWDYYTGEIDENEAAYRLAKGGSSLLAGITADQALKQWKGGLLRGSMRGNLVTACAVLLADTSWQVYEAGGVGTALQDPEFIINLGGGVSAATLGLAGVIIGAKVGGAIGSIAGAAVGGVGGGLLGGGAGYVVGTQGTRLVMETFTPEKLFVQESAYVDEVYRGIENSITKLQTIYVP